jgi:glycosyltransferase involved in cell wall biosynthesis
VKRSTTDTRTIQPDNPSSRPDNGKVLLLSAFLNTEGGVTRCAKNLLSAQIGYDIRLFNIGRPEKKTGFVSQRRYHKILSAGMKRAVLGMLVTLYHMIVFPFCLVLYDPRIVHINGVNWAPFWESAFYLFISKLFRKKVVYHYLDSFDIFYDESGPTIRAMILAVLRRSDAIIILSKKVKGMMEELIRNKSLSLIPSNVDTAIFRKCYERKEQRNARIQVLFMGGQYPFRKGLADILQAIPHVIEQNSNVTFSFSGGDNVRSIVPQCEELGISQQVKFLGWISEETKLALYRDSDILILPSYDEGLPYVIIEALASGIPIVSTHVGGIPEVIEEGVNGFLIEPGDWRALTESILRLSQQPGLRKAIGRANTKKAETQYSKKVALQRIKEIYDGLS